MSHAARVNEGVRLPHRQPVRQCVQCSSRRLPEQWQPAFPSPAPSASFAACAAAGPGRQGPARAPLGVCGPQDTQQGCLLHLAQIHCPTSPLTLSLCRQPCALQPMAGLGFMVRCRQAAICMLHRCIIKAISTQRCWGRIAV